MGIERTLFIIVSIALIVLIVASIVVMALIIALIATLKRLASKVEAATDNWSEVARAWAKRAAPAAVSGLVAAGLKQWRQKSRRSGGEDDNIK